MSLVDVTPPIGGPLAGYGARGVSTGVLDPICAVLALIEDDDQRACVIALDAVGVRVAVADRVRYAVAGAVGVPVESVMLSCTHTHAGPDWFDTDTASIESANQMIAQVVAEAQAMPARLREVEAGVALGETTIGVNRRVDGPDGRAVMGENPSGPIDARVGTVVFTVPGGDIIGTITVATAHANCLKGQNTCLSADFVGAFRDHLTQHTGAPAMLVQGAAGDINPRLRGGKHEAQQTGARLATNVIHTLPDATAVGAHVGVATRRVKVPFAPIPDRAAAEQVARTAHTEWGQPVADWLDWHAHTLTETGGHGLSADITVLRLGHVYIGGAPWELFSQIALDAQAEHATSTVLLCGYINGYYGYLATAEEHARGGYEIEWMPICYGMGTDMPLPMSPTAADLIRDTFTATVARLRSNH